MAALRNRENVERQFEVAAADAAMVGTGVGAVALTSAAIGEKRVRSCRDAMVRWARADGRPIPFWLY